MLVYQRVANFQSFTMPGNHWNHPKLVSNWRDTLYVFLGFSRLISPMKDTAREVRHYWWSGRDAAAKGHNMGRRLPYRPYLTSWEWVIFRINHEIIIGVSNFDPYQILSNFLNVFCNILIHLHTISCHSLAMTDDQTMPNQWRDPSLSLRCSFCPKPLLWILCHASDCSPLCSAGSLAHGRCMMWPGGDIGGTMWCEVNDVMYFSDANK